jgi:hypothetical protein
MCAATAEDRLEEQLAARLDAARRRRPGDGADLRALLALCNSKKPSSKSRRRFLLATVCSAALRCVKAHGARAGPAAGCPGRRCRRYCTALAFAALSVVFALAVLVAVGRGLSSPRRARRRPLCPSRAVALPGDFHGSAPGFQGSQVPQLQPIIGLTARQIVPNAQSMYWYAPSQTAPGDPATLALANANSADRMVVARGQMSLVLTDVPAGLAAVQDIATRHEGVVVNVETSQGQSGAATTKVSLRVPVAAFDQARAEILALGATLLYDHASRDDVTFAYADLDARLTNLEMTETELRALLDAASERHDSVDQILNVYRSINDVRSQIEQLKAQKTELQQRSVTMARIDVTLAPEAPPPVEPPAPGFSPWSVATEAWAQLVHVLEWLATGLI